MSAESRVDSDGVSEDGGVDSSTLEHELTFSVREESLRPKSGKKTPCRLKVKWEKKDQ